MSGTRNMPIPIWRRINKGFVFVKLSYNLRAKP